MIEMIKNKIWNLLKEKEISLAMIYDHEGKILWHKGRRILGADVKNGGGFCKSYIEQSLRNPVLIDVEDYIGSVPDELSGSAEALLIKSVIIYPLRDNYFLYIDSGKKEVFSEKDRYSFKILGELLEQVIGRIREETGSSGISGASGEVARLRDQVVKYSLEEEPVLLTGETGVGKNHIAALIHRYSGRTGKFIIVDTPNISDNLFESKLFGHKKGAFTDAAYDKTGLVEEAANGTLFFDEITEVPMDVQAKLLRFMDTKKYYVLGESREKAVDVRIIAATNRNLHQAVESKEFREDLYYRLNVLAIEIQPLRKRTEDIHSLVRENQILLRGKEIGPGFLEALAAYPWPGNVRELLNILKRAGIMLESPLTGEKISILFGGETSTGPAAKQPGNDTEPVEIREKITSGQNFWEAVWKPFIARELDRKTVKGVLAGFYAENACNFKKVTKALNIDDRDYKNFMSLLYKYKIDPRK